MLVYVRVSIPLSIYWNVPPVYIWMPKRADSSEHLPVFCCEPAASGDHSTFDPSAIFPTHLAECLCLSPPLWWDQIGIKAAKTEQDQMCSPSQKLLIERICICRLICLHYKCASLHLCEGSQICIQSLLPESAPIQSLPMLFWCRSESFDKQPAAGRISVKPDCSFERNSLLMISTTKLCQRSKVFPVAIKKVWNSVWFILSQTQAWHGTLTPDEAG